MTFWGNYLATREGLLLLHICGALLLKTRVILQLGYIFYYEYTSLDSKQVGAPNSYSGLVAHWGLLNSGLALLATDYPSSLAMVGYYWTIILCMKSEAHQLFPPPHCLNNFVFLLSSSSGSYSYPGWWQSTQLHHQGCSMHSSSSKSC